MSISIPSRSLSVEIAEPGGPDVLRPVHRETHHPGESEVLIKVAYAGVNRPDVFQRQGNYPPPAGVTDIPGLEVSGEIVAVGPGTSRWRIGDRVCALLAGGGYAQYAVAHEGLCLRIPEGITLEQAAGMPETFFTVWYNLVERARLQPGEVALIHGGSSGIGTTAIQVATALGARVFTTAGNEEKCRFCEDLGAEKAFDYRHEDFSSIKSLTGDRGADVILDMVGGDYIQKNISSCAIRGRIVSLAFLKGSIAEIDLKPVMLKQLTLTGSTLRGQPVEEKSRLAREVEAHLWPLVDKGRVKPIIFKTLPLVEAAEAHRIMESSAHIGKLVLDCT